MNFLILVKKVEGDGFMKLSSAPGKRTCSGVRAFVCVFRVCTLKCVFVRGCMCVCVCFRVCICKWLCFSSVYVFTIMYGLDVSSPLVRPGFPPLTDEGDVFGRCGASSRLGGFY